MTTSKQSFSLFDLVPGKVVADRYRIVRPYRQSGLAATFEAQDGDEPGSCALLIFSSNLFEGPVQAEEYRSTWDSWMRVGSAHVVKVRDSMLLNGSTVAVATDFPTGDSLRDWLKENGRMDAAHTQALGLQLLDGLIEVHGLGLVHGDIKPQTIYLTDGAEPQALLADGGITTGLWNAKHLGDQTALIGTPFYAPVEQFGGDSPNVQSDIYNLATVLFELVTGVLPWSGSSILEVFQAKLDMSAPSMSARAPEVEVTPELEAAITKGLMTDRRDRYQSAQEFRDQLAAVTAS
jgi:serine/threonine-protein kinase